MFAGRFSSSIGPVGIDYGSTGVKMLQLREQGGRLHVVGASRVELPLAVVPEPSTAKLASSVDEDVPAAIGSEASVSDRLRAAFAAGGFTGRRCVVSLAREDVHVQSVRLPKMPDEELRQSVVWEASQRFGIDRSAIQADFIRTGAASVGGQGSENKEEIILIAASHAAINARLEPLLEAGLRPTAVDPGFASLARVFSHHTRREADRSLVRAVVEIGSSGSSVFIVRGDQIAFCKPIAISGHLFDRAVSEHLQIDEVAASQLRRARIGEAIAEAGASGCKTDPATDRAVYEAVRPLVGEVVKEVTLCLRHYGVTFRGHPPERLILTGGDGLEPNLADTMAKACRIPVVFDDTMGTLGALIGQIQTSLNRTPGPASCWAVAAGLAMRGMHSRKAGKHAEVVARKAAA